MRTRSGLLLLATLAAATAAAVDATAAGVQWTAPATWRLQTARPMRVATYEIPAAQGSEPGECGVFHFGKGQGGSVEDNLARWTGQFEAAATPKKESKTIRGMRVHTIDLSGTYLASGGPMMQTQSKKPGYRLLGAIVEAPRGLVFFKCTGPAATVGKAQQEFESLVGSLTKSAAATL